MLFRSIITFRKEQRSTRGMLSMVLPGLSVGLFAYPLVEAIWGNEGVKYFAMFDMGSAIVIFGICYLLAGYFSSDQGFLDLRSAAGRIARSVPLIVYMLTLAVNLSGLRYPGAVIDVSRVLAKGNMPLSLLLLGIFLEFSFDKGYLKNMAKRSEERRVGKYFRTGW